MIQLLLAAVLSSSQSIADLARTEDEVRARLQVLHEAGDRAGCEALWREDPSRALAAVEEDLEEALAMRDLPAASSSSGKEPQNETQRLRVEGRALWAARIAREALDAPLIADLAFARAGWTESERKHFRDARAIHQRALVLLEKAENRQGLEVAQEAVARALPLGDWHGAASAYETLGTAHQALSSFDDALVAWSQGRVLYRELRLADEEQRCLRGVLDLCYATERFSRGREAADQALAAARTRGDRAVQVDMLGRRAGFEEKLGLRAEAVATLKEAQSLGK